MKRLTLRVILIVGGVAASTVVYFFVNIASINAQTVSCDLTTSPETVTTNDSIIKLQIKTTGLPDGSQYYLRLNENFIGRFYIYGGNNPEKFTVTGGTIIVPQVSSNGGTDSAVNFEEKTYLVHIQEIVNPVLKRGGKIFCSMPFTVKREIPPAKCTIELLNTPFTPEREISIKVSGISTVTTSLLRVILKRDNDQGRQLLSQCFVTTDLVSQIALGKREVGTYYLEVKNSCDPTGIFEQKICDLFFPVLPKGSTSGGSPITIAPKKPPCELDNTKGTSTNPVYVCNTALGSIEANPIYFVQTIMRFLLGIAGGIAFLLIIYSGFKIIASQGNAEAIQGAKETLTSIIVGLLFMIFSVFILQFIAVTVLALPGFGK